MDTGPAASHSGDSNNISDSRFYMWRAIFALAHADGRIDVHEQDMLYRYLDNLPFSKNQLEILQEDVATAQDPVAMFSRIGAAEDKIEFFELARALLWCDGSLATQEQAILEKLENLAGDEISRKYLQDSAKGSMMEQIHDAFEEGGFKAVVGLLSGHRDSK